MARSRTELMVERLRDLQSTTPESEASAVVSVVEVTNKLVGVEHGAIVVTT